MRGTPQQVATELQKRTKMGIFRAWYYRSKITLPYRWVIENYWSLRQSYGPGIKTFWKALRYSYLQKFKGWR